MKQEKSELGATNYWCPICESWFGIRETYEVITNVMTMRNHYSFGYDRTQGIQTKTLHTVCSRLFRLRKGIHAGDALPDDPTISAEYRLINVIGGDVPHERAG